MKVEVRWIVSGVIWGCLLGCGKGPEVSGERTFADLGDDETVVLVNDEPICWRDVKEQLNLEYQRTYWANCGRKADPRDSFYLNFRPWRLRSIVNDLINTRLFDQAAVQAGIEVSDGDFARECESYIQQVNMELHLGRTPTLAAVETKLGVRSGLLAEVIRRDLRRRNYLAAQDVRITNITDQVLAGARQRVSDYNAGVAATNRIQQARLADLRQKLMSGADFVAVGAKCNEYGQEEERHWDALTWEDFKDRGLDLKLRDWSFKAKIGDISDVFKTGQGYSIFKLTRKDEGTKEASAVSTQLARVYLSRITLARFKEIPVTDDASTRARMKANFLRRATQENISKLRSEAHIYYPYGTNLCARLPDWVGEPPVVQK